MFVPGMLRISESNLESRRGSVDQSTGWEMENCKKLINCNGAGN